MIVDEPLKVLESLRSLASFVSVTNKVYMLDWEFDIRTKIQRDQLILQLNDVCKSTTVRIQKWECIVSGNNLSPAYLAESIRHVLSAVNSETFVDYRKSPRKTYSLEQKEAVADILNLLLQYEGGVMQSTREANRCSITNQQILHMAKSHHIELNPVIIRDCGITS